MSPTSPPAEIEYRHRPSVAAYMARALLPSPGLRAAGLPSFCLRWRGARFAPKSLARLFQLCGLEPAARWPVFFPQVLGFPLVMALVTQPRFPEPIWRALQIRNRLTQHLPLDGTDPLDFEARTGALRILDKGAEIDIHVQASSPRGIAWEGITSFYYRGRFGIPALPTADARPPEVEDPHPVTWRMPRRGGWAYGGISGDYNGIHISTAYARLLGFRRAFLHPHRVLGQMLAHAPRGPLPRRLDLWLRGPVPYGTQVHLGTGTTPDARVLALHVERATRPALVAAIRDAA